jgi:transcriptional regulator with XRE-family HTH domain
MKIATGRVVKAIRNHWGYTQKFVASKLNLTPEMLASIENGRVGLDLEKLYQMCLLFKLPMRIMTQLIYEIHEEGSDEGLADALKKLITIQSNQNDE